MDSIADIHKVVPNGPNNLSNVKTQSLNDALGLPETFSDKLRESLLDPLLQDAEAKWAETFRTMEEFNKKLDDKKRLDLVKKVFDIPEELEGNGQDIGVIIEALNTLLFLKEESLSVKLFPKLKVDGVGHLTMLSHSLMAYVSCLEPEQLEPLHSRVTTDVTAWLGKLFRFSNASAFYHEDQREGIIKVVKLAIYRRYERFPLEGFNALYAKPPVVYISASARPGLANYILGALGLPNRCVDIVPCNTMFGSQHAMDITVLEKKIDDDLSGGRVPLLVAGNAGTWLAGHTDNLVRVQEICKQHSMWMHVEGHNLATLGLLSVPSSIQPAIDADSITLTPRTWLGLPGAPCITLYNDDDSSAAVTMTTPVNGIIKPLPLWTGLQALGYEGVCRRIRQNSELSLHLSQKLFNFDVISQLTQVATISAVVVFKYSGYTPPPKDAPANDDSSSPFSVFKVIKSTPLLDAMNTWLHHQLSVEAVNVVLDLVDLENEGVCLRFSPMTSAQLRKTTAADINLLVERLTVYMPMIEFTIRNQGNFRDLVAKTSQLAYLEANCCQGLGSCLYLPEFVAGRQIAELVDEEKAEMNEINIGLYKELEDCHAHITLSRTLDDFACFRLGVVPESLNLEDILDGIVAKGRQIEDNSKVLEKMTELVRSGIEEASLKLVEDQKMKVYQHGLLRQLPVVGSLYSWMSPPPKINIKGRSFNLGSGELETTEATYKYHVQINHNKNSDKEPVAKKRPDPKLVDLSRLQPPQKKEEQKLLPDQS